MDCERIHKKRERFLIYEVPLYKTDLQLMKGYTNHTGHP